MGMATACYSTRCKTGTSGPSGNTVNSQPEEKRLKSVSCCNADPDSLRGFGNPVRSVLRVYTCRDISNIAPTETQVYYVYACIAISRISYPLKHKAAWCSTSSFFKTSYTRDSARFQLQHPSVAMPPKESTRAEILPSCLDRNSRGAEIGFERWIFRSVNSYSNY
ncbi:hypothetical protein T265_00176 [Opisthorchis viverrini]|uniref:Uncharacterized protein n=1 Tax=Opisthorchis viverrini TaxID=6198 RepID=A0A075A2M7_OPIVI|nr:hypothetical protein T265_00176 [Opisthorchis viverrini]KER33968.1 hypothetical protein T265_00176 [Opisthorchis viverrini]